MGMGTLDLIGQAIEANVILGSGMSHLLQVLGYGALDIGMSVNNVWDNWNSYKEDTLSWMEVKYTCKLIIRPWSSTPWLLLLTTSLATRPWFIKSYTWGKLLLPLWLGCVWCNDFSLFMMETWCCNAFRNAHTSSANKPPNNCTNKIVIKMHFHLMQNDINLIQLLESAKTTSHYLWSYGDAKCVFNEAH